MKEKNCIRAVAGTVIGFIAAWYAGAMLDFFPFFADDLSIRAAGFTGLLVSLVLVLCTNAIIGAIRESRKKELP